MVYSVFGTFCVLFRCFWYSLCLDWVTVCVMFEISTVVCFWYSFSCLESIWYTVLLLQFVLYLEVLWYWIKGVKPKPVISK